MKLIMNPHIKHDLTVFVTVILFTLPTFAPTCQTLKAAKIQSPPKFDREEFMVMNLTRGQGSTGFYLVESLRQAKAMTKDLERALKQLEQADMAYAKSRGRADDRFLASPASQIKQAKQTAEQLETQLRDSYQDLKVSIAQTLAFE